MKMDGHTKKITNGKYYKGMNYWGERKVVFLTYRKVSTVVDIKGNQISSITSLPQRLGLREAIKRKTDGR